MFNKLETCRVLCKKSFKEQLIWSCLVQGMGAEHDT